MDFEKIKSKLNSRNPAPMEVKNFFSVLIPFVEVEEELHLIFERRSKELKNQPGEISFPGGRIEEGEDRLHAAIRETEEELLIKKNSIEIIAEGDYLVNPYRAVIYTYYGKINLPYEEIGKNESEVESTFTVPLKYFLENDPKRYRMYLDLRREDDFPYELIPDGKNYKFNRSDEWVLFYTYKEDIIWGLTAKMVYNLTKILKSL